MRTHPEGRVPPAGMLAVAGDQLQECLSVLRTPLPLQLFLPAQPLLPDLQPPVPLQEFFVAQACFSIVAPAAEVSDEALEFEDLQPASGAPASMAATAVARSADLFFTCMMDRWWGSSGLESVPPHGGCEPMVTRGPPPWDPFFPESEPDSAGRDRPSAPGQRAHALHELGDPERLDQAVVDAVGERPEDVGLAPAGRDQIGRASCRERV